MCRWRCFDLVAEQLEIADPSCVKRYTERRKTRLDHQWEIRRVCELKEFAAVEAELRGGGGPVVDVGGRTEGDLHRRGGVAAGSGCTAAGREHADAAGRPAGAGRPAAGGVVPGLEQQPNGQWR